MVFVCMDHLSYGSYVDNWFLSIYWQQSLMLYLLLLHQLRHGLKHSEMCDTQHKYLSFECGLHDTKTNSRELQYVQYDGEDWQQWVRY